MNNRIENMRQLVDMALQSGRKRQNSQTGYLHHYYQGHDETACVTIPLVENFLFVLALLRSRTIVNITEAKTMLEGLLHFQNCTDNQFEIGNFPIYMHEYPACKDRFTAVQVAMAVYWILKLFPQILGAELKRSLEDSFIKMLNHSLKAHAEKPAAYPVALKIGALCQAGGHLLQQAILESEGKRILDHLHAYPDRMAWYCPVTMGAMLSALTLVYTCLSESPWSLFWNHLENTWHQGTCSYVGPAIKEWQDGVEPQVTLYDLFLGYFSGGFSARALRDSIVQLEAVIIPACEDTFNAVSLPKRLDSSFDDEMWHIYQNEHIAYCFIKNYPEINPAFVKGFHPLRIVWGNSQQIHSFVCQGGNSKKIEFLQVLGGVDMIFELDEIIESEDREKNREVVFFTDIHEGLEMLISDHKATTFSFGEELTLRSGGCQLSLVFQLEGEGRFLGHRMLGNRPSQLRLKGKQRFDAYDWQIFMRTIKRSERCVIKASLRVQELINDPDKV
ncbi:MAG: hypothetical protein H0X29_03920 [Parachlamydiaceae bacterium]|nr:hypothetical protein [Parachlamydiaceae bacterium]